MNPLRNSNRGLRQPIATRRMRERTRQDADNQEIPQKAWRLVAKSIFESIPCWQIHTSLPEKILHREFPGASKTRSRETFQLHVNWKRDYRTVSKSPWHPWETDHCIFDGIPLTIAGWKRKRGRREESFPCSGNSSDIDPTSNDGFSITGDPAILTEAILSMANIFIPLSFESDNHFRAEGCARRFYYPSAGNRDSDKGNNWCDPTR